MLQIICVKIVFHNVYQSVFAAGKNLKQVNNGTENILKRVGYVNNV